jgi:hypothetical protein
MVNGCSKSLYFGRKSLVGLEKPTSEVPIFRAVWHLDSICRVFQQALLNIQLRREDRSIITYEQDC